MPSTAAASAAPETERRWSEGLVVLLLLVPPFLVSTAAKEAFRQPKLYASGWLALASLIPLAWGLRRAGRLAPRALWRLPALRLALPILAVATLGLATSAHPAHVREGLLDLWIGAAALAGWSAGLTRPRILLLLRWLLLPAALLAAIGILQHYDLWQPLSLFGPRAGERLAMTSLAGNPGDLAAYLVLPCLLGLFELGRRIRRGSWRASAPFWLVAAALALCLDALLLTQTLAAVTAVALGGLLLLASWSRGLPRRRLAALGAAALGVALALGFGVAPMRQRLLSKVGMVREGAWNAVFSGRFDGWRAAAWMLEEHPWAGVGHGAYRAEFVPAKLALLDRGVSFPAWQPNPFFANAHSEPLEAAAEWGLPGVAALAWALWGMIRAVGAVRARAGEAPDASGEGDERGQQEERGLAWAGTAALGVLSLAYFPFRLALVAYPALLFLGWVLAPEPLPPGTGASGSPGKKGLKEGKGPGDVAGSWLALPLALGLVLALIGQGVRWLHRMQVSRVVLQVELISTAAQRQGAASQALMLENLDRLRGLEALDPVEVDVPIARGTQHLFLGLGRVPGEMEAALGSYQEALALEPRPEIYLHLGRATWNLGRRDEAIRDFRTAVRLDGRLASELPAEVL